MSHTYAGRAERKKHTHTQQEGTWTRAAAAAAAGRVVAGVGHGDRGGGRELASKGPNKLSDTHRRCPATRRKPGWRDERSYGGRTIWDVSVEQ